MPIELKMPALSPTMEEGTLAKWLVKEGDEVKSGDILAEIETDKATMEFEAVDEGKIAKILVPEGTDGVKVGQPIALLAGDGEQISPSPSGEGRGKGMSGEKDRHARQSLTLGFQGSLSLSRRGGRGKYTDPARVRDGGTRSGRRRCLDARRSRGARRDAAGHDDRPRGAARRHGGGDA